LKQNFLEKKKMCLYLKLVKHPIAASLSNHSDNYPTPINISYL